MSEILNIPSLHIDEYQAQVLETRRSDYSSEEWEEKYQEFIGGEYFELQGQHGPALMLLNPRSREFALQEHTEHDLLQGAEEELGDLLWFGVSAADHLGESARQLCEEALQLRSGVNTSDKIVSFHDLESQVASLAPKIRVLTKGGLRNPHAPSEQRYVSLFESPSYVLTRVTFRLTRSLTGGAHDTAPYTASMMEPLVNPKIAIGDYINTIAYVARRIGLDTDGVARSNIDKLRQRQSQAALQ